MADSQQKCPSPCYHMIAPLKTVHLSILTFFFATAYLDHTNWHSCIQTWNSFHEETNLNYVKNVPSVTCFLAYSNEYYGLMAVLRIMVILYVFLMLKYIVELIKNNLYYSILHIYLKRLRISTRSKKCQSSGWLQLDGHSLNQCNI